MAAFASLRPPAASLSRSAGRVLPVVGCAAAVGWGMALLRPGVNELLLSAIGALLIVPLLHRWATGTFDIFEPLTVFLAIYGLLFFVRPIATIATGEYYFAGYDIENAIPALLLIALVGLAGFHVGYIAPWGQRMGECLPRPPRELSPKFTLPYALLLVALGVFLLAVFLRQSGGLSAASELLRGRTQLNAQFFSASNQYVSQGIFLLIPASLILLVTRVERNQRGLIVLALALMLAVAAVSFPMGNRRWLLALAGSAFVLTYLMRGARPKFTLMLVLAIVVLGSMTFYRDARVAAAREDTGLTTIAATSFTQPGQAIEKIAMGADTAPVLAFAVEVMEVPRTNGHRHYGMAALADLAFSPLPRNVWPGKPLTKVDELRASLWGQPCSAAPGALCLDFTLLGDFYVDLGLPGVAGGMFLVGMALRALYSYYVASRGNAGVQLIYAATLPFIVLYTRAGLVPVTGWMAIVVAPLLVGIVLASRGANTRHAEGRIQVRTT